MFAAINADVTPVTSPGYSVQQSDRGAGTPLTRSEVAKFTASPGSTAFEVFAGSAPFIHRSIEPSGYVDDDAPSQERIVDLTPASERQARVALLVRQFEGDGTVEDSARFEILTARMRQLERAQDERTLARLGDVLSEIGTVHDEHELLRLELGL